MKYIDHRREEVGALRPPHRRVVLWRLPLPDILGRPLALASLGRHGGKEEAEDRKQWGCNSDKQKRELEEEEDRDDGSKFGEGAEGK